MGTRLVLLGILIGVAGVRGVDAWKKLANDNREKDKELKELKDEIRIMKEKS